jgi:competence protein ComEA
LALDLAWSRPAQCSAVALVALTAGLLGWHSWQYLRLGTRPTEFRPGAQLDYRVDLNRAGKAELMQLPGVGNNLAERILRYRESHGDFQSVEQLRQVSGIGPAMLERLRPWVCIGTEEEESEPPLPPGPQRPKKKSPPKMPRPLGQREAALKSTVINVNRASQEELQRLPGIGPKLSQRIVDERDRRPFASVDDLRRVPGIGPKTLARLRPYISVSGSAVQFEKTK